MRDFFFGNPELVTAEIPTKVIYAPARQGDVPMALVSNALIKRELGWRPEIRLRDGLTEMIAAHRAAEAAARG